MRRKPIAVLLAVLLLSVLVVSGAAVGGGAALSAGTVVKVAYNKTLKKAIVVDGNGRTVYMWTADTDGTSYCTVDVGPPPCSKLWPPLISQGAPLAGKGIIASKLGTTTRKDGRVVVTYNRHPLYYFSGCCGYGPGDKKPGDVNGQRVFDVWFVLSPKGTPIRK